jgi:hypothetical protein
MEKRPNNLTLYDAASRSLGERLDQVSDVASNPMEGKTGGGLGEFLDIHPCFPYNF